MTKILFALTPPFNPNTGGVQRTTFKLGKFFHEKGIDVYYYSFFKEGHTDEIYGTLFHSNETGISNNPNNIAHMQECLANIQPDIVINQMPYEKPLRRALYESRSKIGYALIGCLRNSLFVFISNVKDVAKGTLKGPLNFLINNSLGYKVLNYLHKLKHAKELKEIIDYHDYYILLAPPNQVELEYFIGNYKSEKVLSIPNSIPGIYHGSEAKDKILLYVGRITKQQKRVEFLLPVWQELYKLLPDWKFLIIGDGDYKDTMQKQIDDLNLPRVEMLGFQKPESYYIKSSIFIMTSSFEGFPNVIIEAQSYGLVPVVFNTYLVLPWIVNDGVDALLCEPYNTENMASQILTLVNDESRRTEMEKKAVVNAERFTIDKVGQIWLDFFHKIGKYSVESANTKK
jgi:glycosyltransferase involved in cell wall biosynthesis